MLRLPGVVPTTLASSGLGQVELAALLSSAVNDDSLHRNQQVPNSALGEHLGDQLCENQ